MDPVKARLEKQLASFLEGVDPADDEALQRAFHRFQAALDAFLQNNPEIADDGRGKRLRLAGEEVLREHQNSFAPKVGRSLPQSDAYDSRGFGWGFITGLLFSFAITFVALAVVVINDVLVIATGETAVRNRLLEDEFQRSLPHVEAIVEYAATVRDEIERRQAEDPDSLEGVTDNRLVHIREVDSALWDARPDDLPPGTGIVIRADREAYKVIVSGGLCRTVYLTKPELVDPRRKRSGLDCTHFGYWNEEGEEL